jgi:uncharacterized membrane protein
MTVILEPNLPEVAQEVPTGNAVAGFAYFTVIPAIFFLLMRPFKQDRFIRINAWQSIFLFALIFIEKHVPDVIELLGVNLDLTIHVWPFILYGTVLLWFVLVYKAFTKKLFKLPILGDLAEIL